GSLRAQPRQGEKAHHHSHLDTLRSPSIDRRKATTSSDPTPRGPSLARQSRQDGEFFTMLSSMTHGFCVPVAPSFSCNGPVKPSMYNTYASCRPVLVSKRYATHRTSHF
ncbi:hypothetical protein T310_8631, partial [Rasamsonia emersonii CBS 393.64]